LQFLDGRFQRPNPLLGFGPFPLLRDQQLDQAVELHASFSHILFELLDVHARGSIPA